MISRSIGFSQTLYSRKSDRGSTAFRCRLAEVNRSVSHACGQTSIPARSASHSDPPRRGEAPATAQVRLGHVDPPAMDEVVETPRSRLLLASGEACLDTRRLHRRIGVIGLWVQEIFEPEHIEGLERGTVRWHRKRCGSTIQPGSTSKATSGPSVSRAAATSAMSR